MLTVYAKNERDDLTAEQLKQLRNQISTMRKKLFDELLESVKQATAIERGKLKPSRVFVVNKKKRWPAPAPGSGYHRAVSPRCLALARTH